MSLSKVVPLFEGVSFKFQGVFLNAFNHVAWTGMNTNGQLTTSVQSSQFGTTAVTANGPRNIELRANLQF